ncbi:MAG: alpha/beta hydrolase [Bacteroidetes bacterium]|nr:MAG: alpha/beta hydrolase [Bacteroidota bacterium]
MKTIFTQIIISLFFANFCLAQLPKVCSGEVKRFEKFESKYVKARNVDVWLPAGYGNNKKYAVLYMHDGQMLFDSTSTWNKQEWGVDETLSKLVSEGKIKDCIVVGAWNSNTRHCDYFPQKPFESLPKTVQDSIYKANRQGLFGENIQSDNYLKFLVKELKPFIDKNFSTLKDRENTFVSGSSMGGLISMYAICEYPKIFGAAACISTHWTGVKPAENNPIPAAFILYLKKNLPSPQKNRIYFDYGTATLDAHYPPFQKLADEVMRSKGFSEKNWITLEFVGKDHSEKAWRERLDIPLTFLLKK